MVTALDPEAREAAEAQEAAAAASNASPADKATYVQRIFSEIAPRYDLLNHVLSLGIDRGWRRQAIDRLGLDRAPEGTFLDLCAGTLDVSAAMIARKAFRGTIVAADFAEPMLRAGMRKVPAHRVTPVVADALALPMAENTFDGAIVAFGIRNVASLDGGLAEVHRVLKPGARFVILEFSTPTVPLVKAAYLFYFHRILPLIGRVISGHKTAYTYLPKSVANFPETGLLAAKMMSAGFRDVQFRTLTFGIAAIHLGTK